MKLSRIAVLILALGLMGGITHAQETKDAAPASRPASAPAAKAQKLSIGDAAPALTINTWLKGSPVAKFEPGKVYVVEFWATWCGPCIASMPHLTELQKKHQDKVTIVSVTSEDPRNTLEAAKKMVADKAEKMGYTVAWDEGSKTNDAYMEAAGQNGIPCSFVVNGEGKIAYIGHPMSLDEVLPKVVDGTFDMAAAKAELDASAKLEADVTKYQMLSMRGSYGEAMTVAKGLVKDSPLGEDPGFLNEVSWTIVDPESKMGEKDKDLDFALKCAEKANELTGDKEASILDTLAHAYAAKGDLKKAVDTEKRAVELAEGPMKEDLQKALVKLEAKAGGK